MGHAAASRKRCLTSTVDVAGLYAFETLLRGAGDDYFNGLRSPVWPEAYFGRIDWARAERGQQLYQTHCQGCHLPPIADLVEVVDRNRRRAERASAPRGEPVHAVAGDRTLAGDRARSADPSATASRDVWIANNSPDMLSGRSRRRRSSRPSSS